MKLKVLTALVVAFVAGCFVLHPTTASAAFTVTISDGTIAGTQSFSNPSNITINYSSLNATLQSYFTSPSITIPNPFNLTTQSNAPGTSIEGLISTTQIVQSIAAGKTVTLTVGITDTFTLPVGTSKDVSNSLSVTSHALGGNGQFTQTTFLDGVGGTPATSPTLSGASSFAQTTLNGLNSGNPYTMETQIVMSFSPLAGTGAGFNGTVNSTSDATARTSATVPEPASAAVWFGLIAVGSVGAWRRSRGNSALN
jgi:hypothetical protein